MRKKKQRKKICYPLDRSPFWRLRAHSDLAKLLGLKTTKLRRIITDREFHYKTWSEDIDGKIRHIVVPVGPIRRIHERMKGLLGRIESPDYLFSPRKGYSPAMNAIAHSKAKRLFKLDIRQFYPSTTREHVFRFFLYQLQMSADIAGALAKLVTFEGKVPFGSPLSPVLCALVHHDIFDAIYQRCSAADNKMSLWVDDLTISGNQIPDGLIYSAKAAIRSKGLDYHKERTCSITNGAVVTGGFISAKGVSPSNKTHIKIRDKLDVLDGSCDPKQRMELVKSLLGLHSHSLSMSPDDSQLKRRVQGRVQWLNKELQKLKDSLRPIAVDEPDLRQRAEACVSVPWD